MREGTRGGEELEVDHLKTRAANAVPAHGAAPREVEDVGFKKVKSSERDHFSRWMSYSMLTEKNKAGYTAISCGRVGRGGNTRFPIFQLERDGPTDRPTNGPTDGRTKPLIELRVRN